MVVQGIVEDPRHRLAGVLGNEAQHGVDRVPQVVGLDLDVDRAAADPGRATVHQDAGVRQREPLALGAGREQELPGAAGQPEGQGGDVARYEPHDVADGEHGRHRTAGGVDPQRDAGAGVLGGEREQLGGEQRAVVVVEYSVEHEYPPQQQLLPDPLAEQGDLVVVSHASSLRHRHRPRSPTLLRADLLTAAWPWSPLLCRSVGVSVRRNIPGLLALGPGLRRGFLLSYDMVFVPRMPFRTALPGLAPPRAVPSDLVVAVASRIVPGDIVQKLVLLAIFVLACAGTAALLDREPLLARLAGGVFYAWNPYVGERLIIGQWALLLGYAGLPWVLRAIITPNGPGWRWTARLCLSLVPAVIGGFAAMAITALVLVPAALFTRSARRAAIALAALVIGSLPWLIPALQHPVYADPAGVTAFAARADTPFGSVGSLLMLGGIWNAQTVPKGYGGAWSALWLAVVFVALAGYVLSVIQTAP